MHEIRQVRTERHAFAANRVTGETRCLPEEQPPPIHPVAFHVGARLDRRSALLSRRCIRRPWHIDALWTENMAVIAILEHNAAESLIHQLRNDRLEGLQSAA